MCVLTWHRPSGEHLERLLYHSHLTLQHYTPAHSRLSTPKNTSDPRSTAVISALYRVSDFDALHKLFVCINPLSKLASTEHT